MADPMNFMAAKKKYEVEQPKEDSSEDILKDLYKIRILENAETFGVESPETQSSLNKYRQLTGELPVQPEEPEPLNIMGASSIQGLIEGMGKDKGYVDETGQVTNQAGLDRLEARTSPVDALYGLGVKENEFADLNAGERMGAADVFGIYGKDQRRKDRMSLIRQLIGDQQMEDDEVLRQYATSKGIQY